MTDTGRSDRRWRETQAERTTLAWTRTSLGVLANGLLLLIKVPHRDADSLKLAAAGFAALLALSTYLIAARRQRTIVAGFTRTTTERHAGAMRAESAIS